MKKYLFLTFLFISSLCYAPINNIEPWDHITLYNGGAIYWGTYFLHAIKNNNSKIHYISFPVNRKMVNIPLAEWNKLSIKDIHRHFPGLLVSKRHERWSPNGCTIKNATITLTVRERLIKDRRQLIQKYGTDDPLQVIALAEQLKAD